MKKLILNAPLTTQYGAYSVSLHADDETRQVTASVFNQDEQKSPVMKGLALCDLSGRHTRIPAAVVLALQAENASERQTAVIESFTRICLARLLRSTGCLCL